MLTLDPTDTIAAVASPVGGGCLGLVRITGPAAFAVALGLFESTGVPVVQPIRRPQRWEGQLVVTGLQQPLEVAVHLWPGTRTYTGQPLAEVETSGAPPILAAVLATYLQQGARLAEPGEFTLRAFLAGRIDLTQAEAVLGVIDAGNSNQLDVALQQLAGGLAGPLSDLRDDLADTLAHLEANLDFADEADVDPLGRQVLAATLEQQAAKVSELAARLTQRDRARGRPRVVLIGPPNVGKSQLFNALIGHDAAIVAPVAGTTRDYLEAECVCDEFIVDLVDTAGVESALADIGAQAQAAQANQARVADLVLDCQPAGLVPLPAILAHSSPARIQVATKLDLDPATIEPMRPNFIQTSATTGAGVVALRSEIARVVRQHIHDELGASVATTAARCREGLLAAARSLAAAAAAVSRDGGDELVAVDLRQALDDLGRIVGAVVTDDLLDRIFRRFCIGK